MRFAFVFALACAAAIGAASKTALASFTPINAPSWADEDARNKILGAQYGGTFTPTSPGSLDYTNGTITAVRVEDIYSTPTLPALPAALSTPANGSLDDQLWQANFRLASAEAVFAALNQEFGYFDGAAGGSYVKLFNATGVKYAATGGADISSLSGHTLRWARGGSGRVWSSKISDNSDQQDHMVTYNIQGLNSNYITWLVLWEDLTTAEHSDWDFNDLVVEIKALPVVPIPEPVALMPLLIGGLLGMRRRKANA